MYCCGSSARQSAALKIAAEIQCEARSGPDPSFSLNRHEIASISSLIPRIPNNSLRVAIGEVLLTAIHPYERAARRGRAGRHAAICEGAQINLLQAPAITVQVAKGVPHHLRTVDINKMQEAKCCCWPNTETAMSPTALPPGPSSSIRLMSRPHTDFALTVVKQAIARFDRPVIECNRDISTVERKSPTFVLSSAQGECVPISSAIRLRGIVRRLLAMLSLSSVLAAPTGSARLHPPRSTNCCDLPDPIRWSVSAAKYSCSVLLLWC
jgi:hypothetical protein